MLKVKFTKPDNTLYINTYANTLHTYLCIINQINNVKVTNIISFFFLACKRVCVLAHVIITYHQPISYYILCIQTNASEQKRFRKFYMTSIKCSKRIRITLFSYHHHHHHHDHRNRRW